MTADSEKNALYCLVCNSQATSLRNSVEIFSDKAVTSSEKPIVKILSAILKTPLNKENASSSILCKKCTKLVTEADELEKKLEEIKLELNCLYKSTSVKSELVENINKNSDELNDHDYIDNIESIETVPVIKADQVKEIKKKAKKISTPKEAKDSLSIVTTEFLDKEDLSSDFKGETYDDLDADKNILSDSADNPLDPDSQIEEVIIEKEVKSQIPPEDITELILKDDSNYVCNMCHEENKENRDSKTIVTHVKDVHNFRIYICDVCGDMFKKRTDLSHHLDEHVATEKGDFQCEVCNRIFNNLRLFRIHKRVHYPQAKSWTCDTCGKRYSSKNLLEEHTNTHTGNRPYVCKECGKDFTSKYTHRAHVKTHGVRPRPFECTTCSKTFLSQQNLTQHMKTHNGVKEHICEQCGKAFGSAHNLEVHSIVHTGYKPYICRTCGKAFARKAEIRDHERTHTGEKPYQCEICGATFSQRSNLQSHKRATHYQDKRYKCEECGKGFKRRRLLDYHIKAAHTGERPFKCETCSATFVYPEHFKKHMRIHTGEKPYLCEVCGKAFNSRDNRNAHRFIHSDKKPYECLVCGMGFMRKPLLYTHMQTQGHLNDTIVVNQPRLTAEDEIMIPDNKIQLIVQNGDQLDENTPLYVTELKDHVIIQEGDQQNVINFADGSEENEDMDDLGDDQIAFDGAEILQCKTESPEGFEEVYGYQDEDGNTVLIPPGTDISSVLDTENKELQLVQIRLPAGTNFGKNWLNV